MALFIALGGLSFNPRAREGRDIPTRTTLATALVSIHAPVKGATRCRAHSICFAGVSIHAPVKGATPLRLLTFCVLVLFQSTRP